MGLKDHLEDVTGRILSLGLDLDYLHVEGTDWQECLSTRVGSGYEKALQCSDLEVDAQGNSSTNSNSSSNCSIISSMHLSSSIYSNCSEEISDSDEEQDQYESGLELQNLHCHQYFTPANKSASQGQAHNQSPREYSPPSTTDPSAEYHTKVLFALKLGYSEELVLLVLKKLGPDALINDMLGELVKLGTRTELEHHAGGSFAVPQCPFSSPPHSSSIAFLDSYHLLCPSVLLEDKENLRPVVVDGSNVAMSHGNKEVFSCQGIQLAVGWFLERGHSDITVFVPAWRKEQSRPDALIRDQEILRRLEKDKNLVFTPSRRVQGRRVVCYDDRFIVKLAYESDGIIVSNDNYRDLANEKPEWKKFIDERLLMYSFVNDKFMPPDDPLGRHGPSLENFLRKRPTIPEYRKQPCPYGKKCTYGHKCKFYHPERGSLPQRSVADELRASAKSSSALKFMPGDTVMGSSQPEGLADACRGPPKTQAAASIHSYCFSDLLEERPGFRAKGEYRRGSNNSGSSYSSSGLLGPFTPGGPLSSGSQDQRDHPGMGSSTSGALGASQNTSYPTCVSPEVHYSSVLKDYFFPDEQCPSSLPSDCSSESSNSSDSFSSDPLFEDATSKCHHHHHCSNLQLYPQPTSRLSPGVGQHAGHGYNLPQVLRTLGDCDRPPMQPSHHHFKPSPSYLPAQLQHASPHSRSGYTGEYSAQTSTPRPHPHPQKSTLGCDLTGFPWLTESQLYEGSPLHTRRDFSSLGQTQHLFASWDLCYQNPTQPGYQPFGFQSLPKGQEKAWHSSWSQHFNLSPRGLNVAQPPQAHPLSVPQHLGPPTQHQELRHQVFVNLCNIFPQDLVRVVMGRNPNMMDAQQLAAAILSEKCQHALN